MAQALANAVGIRMTEQGKEIDYNRSRYATENLWGLWYSATATGEEIAK
jgi:hypothetical protein